MNIAIYGSGGAGKEVFDLLEETPDERKKWEEILYIDDTVPSGEYWGCRRFPFEEFRKVMTPEQPRGRYFFASSCCGLDFSPG